MNHRKPPVAQLLRADSVDTRGYHGQIGDIIRINPYAMFKIEKVLVAIRAEKAGLIEHGLATLAPSKTHWLYTATAQNPAAYSADTRHQKLRR